MSLRVEVNVSKVVQETCQEWGKKGSQTIILGLKNYSAGSGQELGENESKTRKTGMLTEF